MVSATINAAFEASCPLIINKSTQSKPFWNSELKTLRKISRRLKNKAKRTKLQSDWDCFWVSQKLYKRELRAAHRKSWMDYCEAIKNTPVLDRIYKTLTKSVNLQPDVLRLPNGELTTDRKEVAELLLNTHFPGCTAAQDQSILSGSVRTHASGFGQLPAWQTARKVVSPQLIEWGVMSFKPFKSGGPDNIFPAEIQHGFNLLKEHLLTLFRACIAFGYIPTEWARVRIIFIPKIGKTNYWEAKSFRPISLSSAFLKILERLIDRFIRSECLLEEKLCDKQHAYLSGKSCETALHQLVNRVEQALDQKEFVIGTFIDIEGAFDNTSYQSITRACVHHGIDQPLITWIENMLRARKLELDIDGVKTVVTTMQGCPQGGVLSPLIWILVVDSLLVKLNQAGYPTQAYADDLVITISGKFLNTLSELTQNAINLVVDWCSDVGLNINPEKTEMIVFTKKHILNGLTTPKISGQSINLVDRVKFLGVIIDNKLSWAPHIEVKIKKAVNVFWQCRRYFGQTWGLSPKLLHYLYSCFVRPMFAYAAVVWWPRVKLKSTITKLSHLQRIACLAITGAMSTTPTLAIEAILSVPPLDLFILGSASSAAFRLNCTGAWNNRGKVVGHRLIWEFIKSQIPKIGMFPEHISSEFNFSTPYVIRFPTREWWSTEECKERLTQQTTFFTDGSVTESGSGFGVYSPSLKVAISEGLGRFTTIMQAETAAILCCAIEAKKFNLNHSNICIYTDSQAALNALGNPKISSGLVRDCRVALEQLCVTNTVTLGWVPAHCGIPGNEIADNLARSGANLTFYGPDPGVGLSLNVGKSMIKQWTLEQLACRWSTVSSCRQTKHYLVKPTARLTRFALNLNKRDLKNLTQVLTGHGQFSVHLNRMEIQADSTCEFCLEDDDDAEHFVCECPAFATIRRKFLSTTFLAKEQLRYVPWTRLLCFIKASDRFKVN